jgi:CubicO group peptidase (beta-lactamase class C family)
MAKTIIVMLIGIAISEHKIESIDDPVSVYVPRLASTEYGKTSIRDLLHCHRAWRFRRFLGKY